MVKRIDYKLRGFCFIGDHLHLAIQVGQIHYQRSRKTFPFIIPVVTKIELRLHISNLLVLAKRYQLILGP